MEMTGTRTIAAAPAVVWDALNNPAALKACVPGCEALEKTGEYAYRATVAAKIGPVAAKFGGTLELSEVVPPTSYTLKFAGQGGAAGFANGEARVTLAPAQNDHTQLTYVVKAQVGGKIAQIGSRLVDVAAAKLADDFFARFAERLAPQPVEIASAAPAAQPFRRLGARRWVRWIALALIAGIVAYLYSRGVR